MTTAQFAGFGEAAIDFYEGLAADNSKAYWQDHKATYDAAVAQPLAALAGALEPEFGPAKIFRPYRDLRFSADKRPYQEHASMGAGYSEDQPGSGGYYLSLSRAGLMLAGGYHQPAKDQLDRFRRLQDETRVTDDLDDTLAALAGKGFHLADDHAPLKTAPRGYSRDHPRIELIRRTSLVQATTLEPGDWLFDERCLDVVTDGWRTLRVWNAWLDANVGPSLQEAPARAPR